MSSNTKSTVDIEQLIADVASLKETAVVKKTERETQLEAQLDAIAKLGGKLTAE